MVYLALVCPLFSVGSNLRQASRRKRGIFSFLGSRVLFCPIKN